MDPNHWNQYNQAYGRLAQGAAMPGSSAPLNRYDLGLLDQSGLGAPPGMPGLGTLSPSLAPPHSLSPARGMPGLPNLSYGHHSSMSQLLDTMNSLNQGFANPPTYKGLAPTPTQHMYGLPDSLMLPDPLTESQMTKSLFNTDPHTMKETPASIANAYNAVSTPSDSKSSWGLSNFVPPPSNPFGNISESPGAVFSLTPEPPPAHSGSRPSTIQRNPYQKADYQTKSDFPSKNDFPAKTENVSRTDYHSSGNSNFPAKQEFRSSDFPAKQEYRSPEFVPKQEYRAPEFPAKQEFRSSDFPSKQEFRSTDFPAKQEFRTQSHNQVKNNYQSAKTRTNSGHSQSFMESRPRTTDHGMQQTLDRSRTSVQSQAYPPSPQVSNPSAYPESPHVHKAQTSHSQHTSEYNNYFPASSSFSSVPNNSVTYTSASHMDTLTYDPVSPPAQLPSSRSHNSHSAHSQNFAMSLQEITNLGNQDKLHLTDTQGHMASSSPIRVQNKIQGMGGVPSTPSPMQPSPISVGSPQVPMTSPHMSGPMASPQMASSSVPPVPIPIQAVADSTTKPKRSRGRKKKEKTPDLKMMYPGPPPPLTTPLPLSQHHQQPLTPQALTTAQVLREHNERYSMSESPTTMYIANSYDDPFITPSQLMGDAMMPLSSQVTDTSPLVSSHPLEHHSMHDLGPPSVEDEQMQTIDPNDLMDTGFSHNALHNLETLTFPNEGMMQKQKQKRRTKAEQKEMPGSYFMAIPEAPMQHPGGFPQAEMVQDDEFSHLQSDPLREEPKQSFVPKKGTGVSSFQSSFLSFLQGNKQETLSCITNSVVNKKPAMPKSYVPDAPRMRTESFDDSPTLLADPDLKMKALDKSIDVPAVTFSDDEDNSMALSKTVMNVISNLSDDSKSESVQSNPPSVASQQFQFPAMERGSTGKTTTIAPQVKRKVTEAVNDPEFLPRNEVEVSDEEISELQAAAKRDRIKSKEKKPKKKKKKKRQDGEDSGDSSDTEKGYDSDKDPMWMPFEEGGQGGKRRMSSDSDTERKKKSKKDKKSSSKDRKRSSKPYKNVGVINTVGGVLDDAAFQKFQKGDFVVENKMFTGNSFPIWKIDAGRLLQKFEPFEFKGVKCHKGLSTYSSWSSDLKDQYRGLQVQPIHNDTYELVQIVEKTTKPNGNAPGDPLLEDFNVYMQILISRALEASFLQVVREEGEDFYLLPLEKIDVMIEKHKKCILRKVNWTEKFRESVERRPYMNCVDRLGLSKACQACQDHSQPAIKSVELYGSPYNTDTLDTNDRIPCPQSDEFLIGELTATYISTYHALHHFKFSTFKRCTARVDLIKEENPNVQGHEILDQCLQNRNWVLKIFQDFKHSLLKSSGSIAPDKVPDAT